MKVETGHNVQVHYKGTLADGTEFDNSHRRGAPIDFRVGSGRMLPGFNDAVVGMKEGQKKSITLSPEEAYGPHNPKAMQVIPRERFGEDFEFEVGGVIRGNGPRGPFLAKIQSVEDSQVVLDMNHPLAGEQLNFEIELMSIEAAAAQPAFMANWSASMKKAELFEAAKQQGLKVNTKFTKAQLIEALQAAT